MTGPASGGVLAVDGGGQDPHDWSEWDQTKNRRDLAALTVGLTMSEWWADLAPSISPIQRDVIAEKIRLFEDAQAAHHAAQERMFAARRAAGLLP